MPGCLTSAIHLRPGHGESRHARSERAPSDRTRRQKQLLPRGRRRYDCSRVSQKANTFAAFGIVRDADVIRYEAQPEDPLGLRVVQEASSRARQ